MAQAKYIIFETLRKAGFSLFDFYSRCEERGILPKLARWMKLSFLSALVSGLGLFGAAGSTACCPVTCYEPVPPPIHNIEITPNPTGGADSVIVKARATLIPASKDNYVKSAECFITGKDASSDVIQMQPADSSFDGSYEEISAKLDITDIDTGSAKVHVRISTNKNKIIEDSTDIRITE
ncbi:hypothetical protein GX441_00955 [bacterium]|nr:hypothetical protein [bacterium]